ncbi:hypothetical protein Rleg10DRAFT_5599 [Rhizobium leguminosarum bv. trifolii WSM2012]|nr:hypothetical protein Rleg10DRAFT_4386 [Rhizobium leguminosarum bv. trifolii WSM2012]EJC76909.1 hypothetical protein Rleg10DRAFT_5599 [Rhizobium leguminosarum bv. trifolii WSM2012]
MAGRFEALNRLWQTVRESNHDFRATTDIFPILDPEKVARTLEIVERGSKNGEKNLPAETAMSLDDVEQRIVATVEEEKKKSHHNFEDEMQRYSERLRGLDFQGQFTMIRKANSVTLSDYKAEASLGEDELHVARQKLIPLENEFTKFKKKHKLERTARVTSGASLFFRVAFLVFLVAFEMLLNGKFLAQGSESGFVGGVLMALIFAAVNVGVAVFFGLTSIRFLAHKSFLSKIFGVVLLAAYGVMAVFINFGVAHFRESAASNWDAAQTEVVRQMVNNTFGLTEMESWVLLVLGFLFSIGAFLDAAFLGDPYLGFASLQKRIDHARDEYIEKKATLIENLRERRDEHNNKVEDIVRDLSDRRQEAQAIVSARSRLIALFAEHQNLLERTCNSLLTTYREANRKSRTTPEPKYFRMPYTMERISGVDQFGADFNDSEIAQSIKEAQASLSEQMDRIGAAFEENLALYRKLDNMITEEVHVPAAAA